MTSIGRMRRLVGAYPDTRTTNRHLCERELRYFAELARRRPQNVLAAIVADMGGLGRN